MQLVAAFSRADHDYDYDSDDEATRKKAAPFRERPFFLSRESADKPGSVEDGHSSGTGVTARLKQPTREPARAAHCASKALAPLFGLAPGGVYLATRCCQRRGALLPHLFTLACALAGHRRFVFCGTFRGLTPPRRYLAPCPVEPGLSSVAKTTATAWPTPPPLDTSCGQNSSSAYSRFMASIC